MERPLHWSCEMLSTFLPQWLKMGSGCCRRRVHSTTGNSHIKFVNQQYLALKIVLNMNRKISGCQIFRSAVCQKSVRDISSSHKSIQLILAGSSLPLSAFWNHVPPFPLLSSQQEKEKHESLSTLDVG